MDVVWDTGIRDTIESHGSLGSQYQIIPLVTGNQQRNQFKKSQEIDQKFIDTPLVHPLLIDHATPPPIKGVCPMLLVLCSRPSCSYCLTTLLFSSTKMSVFQLPNI